MSIYAFLSLFATLFTFNLGLLVYLKSSRGRLTSIFFFFALTVAMLSFSQFQMRIATNFNDAYLWSKISAIWPYTMILSIHFIMELNRKKHRSAFIYFLLYIPGVIISYIQFSTDLIALPPIEKYWGWSIQYTTGILQIITLGYLVIYWLIILSLLFQYYKSFKGKAKTQVLVIWMGFSLNFITSVTSDVFFPLFGINLPELGSISDIITFALIAYGIWRYDIFSLREDKLSSKLFASISNYLVLVDGNKNIVEINNKLLQKLEYTYDEVFSRNLSYLLESKLDSKNPLSQHINQNSAFKNREIIFKTKSGTLLPITFSASYVKLDNKLNQGFIYVGVDDTSTDKSQQIKNENLNQTNFLAEAAIDLVKFSTIKEIHQNIIEKVYALYQEKAIVVCTEIVEKKETVHWGIRGVKGIHSNIKELSKLLGFDIYKSHGSTTKEYLANIQDGKLHKVEFKLSEFTSFSISKTMEKKIIQLFKIKELHVIPLLHENKVSGVISIIYQKHTPHVNSELLESFIAIASIVLKRKYYEDDLADLNHMQNKLFSVIGHDLKSPISNILSYTDMITKDYDSFSKDALLKFFESIQRSAYSGFDILNSLLLWAKSVQGGIPINQTNTNIEEIVSEAIDQIMPLAVKKNIKIHHPLENRTQIFADKNMLITVVRNLLSNSIKFTHLNGNIQIDTISKDGTIFISIIDDGIGMNQSQLNKLFILNEVQVGRGTAGEKGSGFGLLICKDFVEKNGGSIKAESTLNKGSSFTISFPLINEVD